MQKQKTAQYSPWNPGFAAYGTHSETHLIPPESPIASLVCQFYEIKGCKGQALLSAIPDGCHDFIFVCDSERMRGFFSVSVDAPTQFAFENGAVLLGIRFLPGATFALHRENIAPYLNHPIPLEEIFPESTLFAEELFFAPTFAKRHALLMRFLQAHRLAENAQQNLLRYCTERILRSHGQCSVAELAQATGYSTRYIHDLCKKSIGNSPKLLGKTIRMQHAATLIRRQPQIPLSAIAAESGYADQSHLYRDFLQLTCHSPRQIRANGNIQLAQKHIKITYFQ